jgi:hypothetical protein
MGDRASVFDQALKERLGRGGEEPLAVVVTFSHGIAKTALDTLGLYATTGDGPSTIAYGTLSPAAVRRLGSRPDVTAISLAAVLPARGTTALPAAAADKIQAVLRAELEEHPADPHTVIVYFRRQLPEETLAALDLVEIDREAAKGRLYRAAILQLAGRTDVKRIEMVPRMRPFKP